MVDFNNETTIGRPATDIERVLILQRRDAVIDAIEAYTQADAQGAGATTSYIKSRLESLRLQLIGMLNRRALNKNSGKAALALTKRITSDEFDNLVKTFENMSDILDELKLTRIDTKADYDPSDIEADNKADGL